MPKLEKFNPNYSSSLYIGFKVTLKNIDVGREISLVLVVKICIL